MGKKRFTIGVLSSWVHDLYHQPICNKIIQLAEENDINLLIYSGTDYQSPDPAFRFRPAVYELAAPHKFDGIIVLNSLGVNLSYEWLKIFFERYSSIPTVSIGAEIDGTFSILIDEKDGVYREINHLIKVHGYKRIGYFRGPYGNREADLRCQGYMDALKDNGLPIEESIIFNAGFDFGTAVTWIRKILKDRGLPFEALACGNDTMALGAMYQLHAEGYKVPGNIALAGFDDCDIVRTINPPLTTIRHPLIEVAEKAFFGILAMLNGECGRETVVLSTELIIRQSCGCLPVSVMQIGTIPEVLIVDSEKNGPKGKEFFFKCLETELIQPSGYEGRWCQLLDIWVKSIASAAIEYLEGRMSTEDVLYKIGVTQSADRDKHFSDIFLLNSLNKIRDVMIKSYCNKEQLFSINTLFQKASVYLEEYLLRPYAYNNILDWKNTVRNLVINQDLIGFSHISELFERFNEILNFLDIEGCFISKFAGKIKAKDAVNFIVPVESENIFFYKKGMMVIPEERFFNSCDLGPKEIAQDRRFTYLILSLNSDIGGFIVFDVYYRISSVFEMIRSVISKELGQVYVFDELIKAKAAAVIANRDKSEFLSNISHEIRTPLNSIIGFADILIEEIENPALKDKLETIDQAGKNLLHIINEILDFSKLDTGRVDFHMQPFSSREFFSHIRNLFIIKAEEKQLAFSLSVDPAVPSGLIGDKPRVSQIIINLVGNAIKFTQYGGIGIEVEYLDGFLVVKVADTGIGIPDEQRDAIFKPFVQANAHISHTFGGTGLGLAITAKLVEQMEGVIQVKSREGEGSIFIVKLPLAKADWSEGDELLEELEPEQTLDQIEKRLLNSNISFKILIAEDDEFNRNLYVGILERYRLDISFAENGEVALRKLRENSYDLLLLDMHMPVMDGVLTISAIREDAALKGLYAIAVTAHAMKGDEQRFIDLGCDDYLAKPLDKQLLIEKIARRVLAKAGIDKVAEEVEPGAKSPSRKPVFTAVQALFPQEQVEPLRKVLEALKKCRRIFSEEKLNLLAARIRQISGGSFCVELAEEVDRIASDYDIRGLNKLIKKLEKGLDHE